MTLGIISFHNGYNLYLRRGISTSGRFSRETETIRRYIDILGDCVQRWLIIIKESCNEEISTISIR